MSGTKSIETAIAEIRKVAKTKEKFERMEMLLGKLPASILKQIVSAEFGLIGLECNIRVTSLSGMAVLLPNTVTQIANFDDYIGIYNEPYFFKVMQDPKKGNVPFVFIPVK